MSNASSDDLEVLTEIIASLKQLNRDDQRRTLQAVATFLNLPFQGNSAQSAGASPPQTANLVQAKPTFSEDRTISVKDFIREKGPRTDIERVICLAYYLAHYRATPHFKTLDISALNTEAAQPKFSNASVAVENATRSGLLVQATKGNKQVSAAGEVYVQHLPDRDAAKSGSQSMRRKPRKVAAKKSTPTNIR